MPPKCRTEEQTPDLIILQGNGEVRAKERRGEKEGRKAREEERERGDENNRNK